MLKQLITLLTLFFWCACAGPANKPDPDTIKNGNSSTTLSTNPAKLSKIINLESFTPTRVKFKYTFIDNSGQDQRLSVPGPSDSQLEALLWFDTASFEQLKKRYAGMDYPAPTFDKFNFNFDWLDPATRDELLKSDSNYHGHPDLVFIPGPLTRLWLFDNKVLLLKSMY
jgi:hypothetical protein